MEKLFEMNELLTQCEHFIRILLAGICGGLIGYERESKRKIAGLRTHVIVAVSSALMIVLSKYGFNDVLGSYIRLDPSRIAAGAVTAIGFLGSGIIFSRNNSVSGLTTSAGIWGTVGVGMAMGSGMYAIGIATTFIILLVEVFLGRRGKLADMVESIHQIEIEYNSQEADQNIPELIRTELKNTLECKIIKFQVRQKEDGIKMTILVKTIYGDRLISLSSLVEQYKGIKKITF